MLWKFILTTWKSFNWGPFFELHLRSNLNFICWGSPPCFFGPIWVLVVSDIRWFCLLFGATILHIRGLDKMSFGAIILIWCLGKMIFTTPWVNLTRWVWVIQWGLFSLSLIWLVNFMVCSVSLFPWVIGSLLVVGQGIFSSLFWSFGAWSVNTSIFLFGASFNISFGAVFSTVAVLPFVGLYSRVITSKCFSISHIFFPVATCTRVLVCISLSYLSLMSLVDDTSVILVVRTYAVFANSISMILSSDFSFNFSEKAILIVRQGVATSWVIYDAFDQGIDVPNPCVCEREITKAKFQFGRWSSLFFVQNVGICDSFNDIQNSGFFWNCCLIWSRIFSSSVQSGFLADETMYEHSSNSWMSSHTHFLALFFERLSSGLSFLFERLSWVLSCNVAALAWSRGDSSFRYASHAFYSSEMSWKILSTCQQLRAALLSFRRNSVLICALLAKTHLRRWRRFRMCLLNFDWSCLIVSFFNLKFTARFSLWWGDF